jgi:hypothetical protein
MLTDFDITTIYEPAIYKMWEPRCLTILWASTAGYNDSLMLPFTFHGVGYIFPANESVRIDAMDNFLFPARNKPRKGFIYATSRHCM